MNCGQIVNSIEVWRKLSGIPMSPAIALKILRYTKIVANDYEIIEKLRVSTIREIAGVGEEENAEIPKDSPKYQECIERINAIMGSASTLSQINLSLEVVVVALEGHDVALTVSDLAVLEPFFQDDTGYPQPDGNCSE